MSKMKDLGCRHDEHLAKHEGQVSGSWKQRGSRPESNHLLRLVMDTKLDPDK